MTILFSLWVLLRDSLTMLIVINIGGGVGGGGGGQYLRQMLPLPHNNPPLIKREGLFNLRTYWDGGLIKGSLGRKQENP